VTLPLLALLASMGCAENRGMSTPGDTGETSAPPDISGDPYHHVRCDADAGVPLTAGTAETFVRWVGSIPSGCSIEKTAAQGALMRALGDAGLLDALFALIDDSWISDATVSVMTLTVIGALGRPEALPGLQVIVARPVPASSGGETLGDAHTQTEVVEVAAVQAMRCLHTPEADAAVSDVAQHHPDAAVRRLAASSPPPKCTLAP
jgi:hypothetical protein